MPKEYVEMIKLRLDSNVIFYEKEAMKKFSLFDIFAVKGGPLITLDIGDWDTENGTRLKENIVRWERRTDLKGAEFINALAFNGAAAQFIYDHYCEYSAARIFVLRLIVLPAYLFNFWPVLFYSAIIKIALLMVQIIKARLFVQVLACKPQNVYIRGRQCTGKTLYEPV